MFAYPERPTSLSDDQATIEYVKQYERAYRANYIYGKYGEDLVRYDFTVKKVWTHEAPDAAAVVRLRYSHFYEYETARATESMHGDGPDIYVTYYVDDSMVVRAVKPGYQDDESDLDPDPWENGSVVECF